MENINKPANTALTQEQREDILRQNEANGNDELFGDDGTCVHDTQSPPGGGVRCKKCGAWFCF